MTLIHSNFYQEIERFLVADRSVSPFYIALEAKTTEDGTMWVRVVKESDEGKKRMPLITQDLEIQE